VRDFDRSRGSAFADFEDEGLVGGFFHRGLLFPLTCGPFTRLEETRTVRPVGNHAMRSLVLVKAPALFHLKPPYPDQINILPGMAPLFFSSADKRGILSFLFDTFHPSFRKGQFYFRIAGAFLLMRSPCFYVVFFRSVLNGSRCDRCSVYWTECSIRSNWVLPRFYER